MKKLKLNLLIICYEIISRKLIFYNKDFKVSIFWFFKIFSTYIHKINKEIKNFYEIIIIIIF